MKFLLISLILSASSAFACSTLDVHNWFTALGPYGLNNFCEKHGGKTVELSLGTSVETLRDQPTTAVAEYTIRCKNGDTLVGTLYLDAATCQGRSATTQTTITYRP